MRNDENLRNKMDEKKEVKNEFHPLLDMNHNPMINVVHEDVFKTRVEQIFEEIACCLEKSYGPYGSSTIISNYPFNHVTKDGFSIMKFLSFSKEHTIIDDAIKNLIEAPCARLNNAVGDGTTTIILSVYNIYKEYMSNSYKYGFENIPPRDILTAYKKTCESIIKRLEKNIQFINVNDHKSMVDAMRDIAYISSNGDEEITGIICDLYDELDAPMINIEKAPDGITKKVITSGYSVKAILKDSLYVNNDNFSGKYKDIDIILFGHKLTADSFNKIIFPLSDLCRSMKRKLLVMAPAYDEVAMLNIRRILTSEFKATGECSIILMEVATSTNENMDLYSDFAMLTNTSIINRGMEKEIFDAVDNQIPMRAIFDIDNREIPDININYLYSKDGVSEEIAKVGTIADMKADNGSYLVPTATYENPIRLGFAKEGDLKMKGESIFSGFFYNENIYNRTIENVAEMMNESFRKSEALGNLNLEGNRLQTRLYNLKMKVGTIEVGGDSALSQGMLYDAVDDTVKATRSAYRNGIVSGISTSTIRACLEQVYDAETMDCDPIIRDISHMILHGFEAVYETLLCSRYNTDDVFDSIILDDVNESDTEKVLSIVNSALTYAFTKLHTDMSIIFTEYSDNVMDIYRYMKLLAFSPYDENIMNKANPTRSRYISASSIIIVYGAVYNIAFDITDGCYNTHIINSAKTDIEVLRSSSDLISLLITGNQFIIADH